MLIKLVHDGQLGSITNIGEDQYIIQKKIVTFKCQTVEMEFKLSVLQNHRIAESQKSPN